MRQSGRTSVHFSEKEPLYHEQQYDDIDLNAEYDSMDNNSDDKYGSMHVHVPLESGSGRRHRAMLRNMESRVLGQSDIVHKRTNKAGNSNVSNILKFVVLLTFLGLAFCAPVPLMKSSETRELFSRDNSGGAMGGQGGMGSQTPMNGQNGMNSKSAMGANGGNPTNDMLQLVPVTFGSQRMFSSNINPKKFAETLGKYDLDFAEAIPEDCRRIGDTVYCNHMNGVYIDGRDYLNKVVTQFGQELTFCANVPLVNKCEVTDSMGNPARGPSNTNNKLFTKTSVQCALNQNVGKNVAKKIKINVNCYYDGLKVPKVFVSAVEHQYSKAVPIGTLFYNTYTYAKVQPKKTFSNMAYGFFNNMFNKNKNSVDIENQQQAKAAAESKKQAEAQAKANAKAQAEAAKAQAKAAKAEAKAAKKNQGQQPNGFNGANDQSAQMNMGGGNMNGNMGGGNMNGNMNGGY